MIKLFNRTFDFFSFQVYLFLLINFLNYFVNLKAYFEIISKFAYELQFLLPII